MSRTWSGIRTTAEVGGALVEPFPQSDVVQVGARGSSTSRSPPDSTKVEATTGCQSSPAFQNGCLARQIQSPGAKSLMPTDNSGGSNLLPQTAQSYLRSV